MAKPTPTPNPQTENREMRGFDPSPYLRGGLLPDKWEAPEFPDLGSLVVRILSTQNWLQDPKAHGHSEKLLENAGSQLRSVSLLLGFVSFARCLAKILCLKE